MRYCAFLFAYCSLAISANAATVTSTLSPMTAHVGDELSFVVSVQGAEGKPVSFPMPSSGGFEGFELLHVDSTRHKENTLEYSLSIYDTGSYTLFPQTVVVGQGAQAETLRTVEHKVRIESLLSHADTSLRAIKPYAEHPFQWRELLAYWWIVALAAAGLLGWWIWKKYFRKAPIEELEPPVPLLPPYEEAVRGLIALREEKYPQRGMMKEFYSEFSHVMRRYLERRYEFPALEMTTFELEYYFEDTAFPKELRTRLLPLLRESDLVKFAKFIPGPKEAEHCTEAGFELLKLTRPVEDLQTENAEAA